MEKLFCADNLKGLINLFKSIRDGGNGILLVLLISLFRITETFLFAGRNLDLLIDNNAFLLELLFYILLIIYFMFSKKDNMKERKPNIVETTINHTNEINKSLEEIRKRQKADYVSISLFHNGTVTFNRVHLLKMSRLYEAYSKSLVSRISVNTTTEYPLLPYYSNMMQLITDSYIYVPDSNEEEDLTLKQLLKSFGVESCLYLPVYNGKELIGFMVLEWLDKTNFDRERINAIRNEYKYIQHFFN